MMKVKLMLNTYFNVCLLIKSGIPDNQIEIVVEPEAALIYCHLMHLDDIQERNKPNSITRKPGIKYMVLDLGGKYNFSVLFLVGLCESKPWL